jgi:hypothetical protein
MHLRAPADPVQRRYVLKLAPDVELVIALEWPIMSHANEIEALKASMRGVRRSFDDLNAVSARIEALDPHTDVPDADLDDLRRLTLAHAIAAQALRGLVVTMSRRRGKIDEAIGGTGTDMGEE